MHPYVKLHKPLRLVLPLLIMFMMILCPVHSENYCSVRTVQLYSEFSSGYLRIDKMKTRKPPSGPEVVTAPDNSVSNMNKVLYTVTLRDFKDNFLIYDPNWKMFLCWNKTFTGLTTKRNPRRLHLCKFSEKISISHPKMKTRYTTTYVNRTNGLEREVELRFNKRGHFAKTPKIRQCLEGKKAKARHHHMFDIDYMTNLDTLLLLNITTKHHMDPTPTERIRHHRHQEEYDADDKNMLEAYNLLSGTCANADFLVQKGCAVSLQYCDCRWTTTDFCKQMKKRHKIAKPLRDFCQPFW